MLRRGVPQQRAGEPRGRDQPAGPLRRRRQVHQLRRPQEGQRALRTEGGILLQPQHLVAGQPLPP